MLAHGAVRARRELLVRWKGYGAEHDQWQLRSRAGAHRATAVAEFDALQQGGSPHAAQAALYQLLLQLLAHQQVAG